MWPGALARRLIAAFWRHSNLMSGMSYAHRVDLVPGLAAVSYFVPCCPGRIRFELPSVLKLVHHADAASGIIFGSRSLSSRGAVAESRLQLHMF